MTENLRANLYLLGDFVVRPSTDSSKPLVMRRKTRALLAYLAATNKPQPRSVLIDLFCQETAAPPRVLTLLLSRIRKQVGRHVLHTYAGTVQLNAEAVWVDYLLFQKTLTGDLNQKTEAEIETAVSLYRAEFLSDINLPKAPEFELWLLGQRTHARQLVERGLMELVQRLIAREAYDTAVTYTIQLLQHNPLIEEAHAQLIWLYAQTGQREAALRQYDRCRALLEEELGVEPTPEMQILHEQIVAGSNLKKPQNRSPVVPNTAPAVPINFVGRGAELAQLRGLWQAAAAGHGGGMLISGQAGSGKSRLVQIFIDSVMPVSVAMGRCYESTAAIPYFPWIKIIEMLVSQLDVAVLQTLPPFTQDGLLRLLPNLNSRLKRPLQPHVVQVFSREQSIDNSESDSLFPAILDFLTTVAAAAPLLLTLDDLQWADKISLRLFHYLATQVDNQKILLLGAYRLEDVSQSTALNTLVHDLSRVAGHQLKLAPLPTESIAALVTQLLRSQNDAFQSEIVARLAHITGGNAFFVTELLQELATQNLTDHAEALVDFPIPDSVQLLIQQRLNQLSESDCQVIEAIAVLGVAASFNEIQQCSGRSEEETSVAIDNGMKQHILKLVVESSPAKVTFQHDLVREAIVAEISPMRFRLLNRRVARMLVATLPTIDGLAKKELAVLEKTIKFGETAARIFHHAALGEAFALMFQWALPAAEYAIQKLTYEDAMENLDAARDAFHKLPVETALTRSIVEQRLLAILLKWLWLGGMVGKPLTDIKEALDEANQLLRRYRHEKRQAEWHLYHAIYASARANFQESYELALTAYEHFMDLEDFSLAAYSLNTAASAKITISQNQVGWLLFQQATQLYNQAGDERGAMRNLEGLAWTAINLGEIETALDNLTQLLTFSQADGDVVGQVLAMLGLGVAWYYYGDSAQMRLFAESAYQHARQTGHHRLALRARLLLGVAYFLAGEWETARKIFAETLARSHQLGAVWDEGWSAQFLGRMALREGALEKASHLFHLAFDLRQASGQQQNQISDLGWLGRLALAQGQVAQALNYTEEAYTLWQTFQDEFYVLEMPDVLMCHAEVLAANGRLSEAAAVTQQAYDLLQKFAGQIKDPQVKNNFLSHPTNLGILEAVD